MSGDPGTSANRTSKVTEPPFVAIFSTLTFASRRAPERGDGRQRSLDGQVVEQVADDGVVDAGDGQAVFRDLPEEGQERGMKRGLGPVIIEMLGVDVRDDADFGWQLDERAVRLVGLDHHPAALSDARVRSPGRDHAAHQHGRIEARLLHHPAGHGGRGGLAVRAGDRDRAVSAHQRSKRFRAVENGKPQLACRFKLGIGLFHGGGDDNR